MRKHGLEGVTLGRQALTTRLDKLVASYIWASTRASTHRPDSVRR